VRARTPGQSCGRKALKTKKRQDRAPTTGDYPALSEFAVVILIDLLDGMKLHGCRIDYLRSLNLIANERGEELVLFPSCP